MFLIVSVGDFQQVNVSWDVFDDQKYTQQERVSNEHMWILYETAKPDPGIIYLLGSTIETLENVWSMFEVNRKYSRTTSMMCFGVIIVVFGHILCLFVVFYCWIWAINCLLGSSITACWTKQWKIKWKNKKAKIIGLGKDMFRDVSSAFS